MRPFRIATGTMTHAQNTFIRIHADEGIYGVGECSAFPMITGETQGTCFEMAREFASVWKNKNPLDIDVRLEELNSFTSFNTTIKSAFDMALHDIAAKVAGLPLYAYLGGAPKPMETDLTVGLDVPVSMAEKARDFVSGGVQFVKIKLGTTPEEDISRVRLIREAVGENITLRVDANQGWSFDDAISALRGLEAYNVQFCEQPMRTFNDRRLPELRKQTSIPLMADESVFNHHDALRVIADNACDYVNIKFAKAGGIREAVRVHDACARHQIPCMIGGMLESRVALTAFAHFAAAHPNVVFFDMDTCMLGHLTDPVRGGVRFKGFQVELPDVPGVGADIEEQFLHLCEKITI